MRINHNISAQMANVNLKKTDSRLSASLERLSSGYKINKAADDSAGMAISNKMKAQIRALDQASRNSEEGQSIIETAEGAIVSFLFRPPPVLMHLRIVRLHRRRLISFWMRSTESQQPQSLTELRCWMAPQQEPLRAATSM